MSDRTPSQADWDLARPWIEDFEAGIINRGTYWRGVEDALRTSRPWWSSRDVNRVARIMAPFALRDRYAPR